MVRKLKHHEQRLLRKVGFHTYKSDNNHRAAAVCLYSFSFHSST